MNKFVNQIKENPIGGIAGGAAGFFGAKKLLKVTRPSLLILATILGAGAGIFIQSNVMKKSATK